MRVAEEIPVVQQSCVIHIGSVKAIGDIFFCMPVSKEGCRVFHNLSGGGYEFVPFVQRIQHRAPLRVPKKTPYVREVFSLQAFMLTLVDQSAEEVSAVNDLAAT
jgi:hypothetical protein